MSGMKPVKPEDKPKVIALGAATLVMFGYVGVSFARSKSGSPEPAPSPAAPTLASTPGAPSAPLPGNASPQTAAALSGKANAAQEMEAGAARQKVVLPDLSIDPFQPVVSHKPVAGAASDARIEVLPPPLGAKQAKPAPTAPFLPPIPGTTPYPVTATTGGTLPGVAANPTPMMVGGANVVPLELALKLNGVITGSAGNVALIQVGESEQFVSVGDVLLRWRVLRIGIDTVTLRRANQVRVLRVGAGNNVSDAIAVGPATKPQAVPTPIAVPARPPDSLATPAPQALPIETVPVIPTQHSTTAPTPQGTPMPPSSLATPLPEATPTAPPTPAPAGPPQPVVG